LSLFTPSSNHNQEKQIAIKVYFIENMYLNLETQKNKPQKLLKKETRGGVLLKFCVIRNGDSKRNWFFITFIQIEKICKKKKKKKNYRLSIDVSQHRLPPRVLCETC
jgi:uncharacterized FlgJ-related protein